MTDETLANSTSDNMTSDVVWAAKRAAPYCKARLPNKNETHKTAMYGNHVQLGACQEGTTPRPKPTKAAKVAMTAPPPNMASVRDELGVCFSLAARCWSRQR